MDCMKDTFMKGLLLDDRYQAISALNHGSFGMVFMAKDVKSGDHVAIKCLTKLSATKLEPGASIVDDHSVELICHNRLGSHPNIVNLLHSFETETHLYLVLELCSMGDLYEAISSGRGPVETDRVRALLLQLLDAVNFMHSKGLYHRDIKPENIFLSQDGSLKLGDFGLATSETWSFEASVGSDRYMAPEQYDPADTGYSPAQADIWSIGICLLNVLFSRNPFVTPTESDVLFSDYVRDKQSLFDIFPSMSQDTFEVLNHALALDPTKRSIAAIRNALLRVVSFTTEGEIFEDDFCTEGRNVVPASANREPLRTPSIQSPLIDQGGAFPWAKALHVSSPRHTRQLSAIPDSESFTEELFPASEKDNSSWYSEGAARSSMASGLESAFNASVNSMSMKEPEARYPPRAEPVFGSGSLPVRFKRPLPAMSMVFGKKEDTASKSWSDLYDEDEEDALDQEAALDSRHVYNSQTWSSESLDQDLTVRRKVLTEIEDPSGLNTRTQSPMHEASSVVDKINENDGVFCQNPVNNVPRYSPPAKRNTIMDKWAALGSRRRAAQAKASPDSNKRAPSTYGSWRQGLGFNLSAGVCGSRENKDNVGSKVQDWRRQNEDKIHEDSDHEWVGGWSDLHL